MKFLLHLLFAIALAVSSGANAAPRGDCCGDQDCAMVQCMQMGCAAVAAPIAAPALTALRGEAAVRDYAPVATREVVLVFEEIWTPPD